MPRFLLPLVSLGLLLGAAACDDDASTTATTAAGGGAAPTTAAPSLGYNTCEVVPVDLVNRHLGLSLPPGTLANAADPRTCEYGTYSFDGTGNVMVTIAVAQSVDRAASMFDDLVFQHSGQLIAGVGDEAASAPFSSQFVVRQGNVVVNVYAVSGQARLNSDDPELQSLALEILGISASLPGAATTPAAQP